MSGRLRLVAGLCTLPAVLAACAPEAPPIVPWLYEAPLPLAPRPPTTGGFGRGTAPLALAGAGIVAGPGVAGGPLVVELLLAADAGPAEAVGFGASAGAMVLELYDVDAGVVRWRDATVGVPPYAITPTTVVAGDGEQVIGLDRRTGAVRWRHGAMFRARDGETIAAGDRGALVLIDARTGEAGPRLTPPATPAAPTDAAVVAVCAAAPARLYAWHQGALARWDLGAGDALVEAWSTATPQPARLDACGATVLVAGAGEVLALDPATGAVVGGPVAANDYWMARSGDGVELATDAGIEARDARLGAPRRLEPVAVERLVVRRGGRRLVALRDRSMVLLDEHGARALTAGFGAIQVALGDRHLLAGPWAPPARSQAARVARWALPVAGAVAAPNLVLDAPLLGDPPYLDLPAPIPLPAGVAQGGAGAWAVGAALVDSADPERVYVGVLEAQPTETTGGGLAAYDLHRDAWRWHVPDACPPGTPVALAAASGVVVCGARGVVAGQGGLRAVHAHDGAFAWEWRGETVDAVLATGGTTGLADVVLVVAGAEVVVLDGATGAERARWRTSDGYWPRLALARRAGDTVIASHEHGRVVLRSARLGLRPLAALEVGGTLAALFAVGDRIAAELTDGTLYFLDDHGAAVAAGALYRGWRPAGDLALATARDGDNGLVVGVGPDGLPRIFAGLPGSGPLTVAGRGGAPGAPVVVVSSGTGRATVLGHDGVPTAVLALPPDALRAPIVATVADGVPVVGVILARPLRFVRVDVAQQ